MPSPRLLVLLSLPLLSLAADCPTSLLPFRTSNVQAGVFSESRLSGFFYEQSYKDLAQIGASCQTMNVTSTPDLGKSGSVFNVDFAVKYGRIPFTINELYTPLPGAEGEDNTGSYVKTVDMPGGDLLKIPLVVVDATIDKETGLYDSFTMYGCFAGGDELYFVTRGKERDEVKLQNMYDVARGVGIKFEDEDLNVVESC